MLIPRSSASRSRTIRACSPSPRFRGCPAISISSRSATLLRIRAKTSIPASTRSQRERCQNFLIRTVTRRALTSPPMLCRARTHSSPLTSQDRHCCSRSARKAAKLARVKHLAVFSCSSTIRFLTTSPTWWTGTTRPVPASTRRGARIGLNHFGTSGRSPCAQKGRSVPASSTPGSGASSQSMRWESAPASRSASTHSGWRQARTWNRSAARCPRLGFNLRRDSRESKGQRGALVRNIMYA